MMVRGEARSVAAYTPYISGSLWIWSVFVFRGLANLAFHCFRQADKMLLSMSVNLISQHYNYKVYMKNPDQRKIWLAEILLFVSTAFNTWLLACAGDVKEYFLSVLFQFIIMSLDVSIFLGVLMNFNFQAGLSIFYFWRVMALIFGQEYTVMEHLVSIASVYGMYKLFAWGLVKVSKIEIINSKDIEDREANRIGEQKRRTLTLVALSFAINLGLVYLLPRKLDYVGSLLFLINLVVAVAQIHAMRNSQNHIFRLVTNLMPYNLLFFVVQAVFLPWLFFNDWFIFLRPVFIHLVVLVILMRVFIGATSNKFDRNDEELFKLVYAYSGTDSHKYYRYATRDNRLLKLLDQMSRRIGYFLYFLGFFIAIHERLYGFFALGTILTNLYALQDNFGLNWISQACSKFNYNLHLNTKIILPLVFLWYILLVRAEISQTDLIYYSIHNCFQSTNLQHIGTIILACITITSQLIPLKLRLKIHLLVQLSAPLYILFSIWTMECQNINLVLMGFYCLSLCFTIIRDEKLALLKGGKQQ